MQKFFGDEKYKFYLSNINTSIIFNNESIKNKIINLMQKESFNIIDPKTFDINLTIKEYLQIRKFNMKLIPYYGLEKYLLKNYSTLTFEEKIFLKIITSLNIDNKLIIFDDVLTFLNDKQKYLVLTYLKENDITFINFTSDIEETLYSKYLIVLNEDGVLIEGSTRSVLKQEKILKHNGFALPFIVDLSHQLMDYGILDKEYYSINKMVIALWK